MKKVIIYPGRFQPMLSHHAQVFDQLGALYNDADVYIATSDKVEPGKSPFNFEEKKKIIASHGIDPSKVLYARSPYNWEELSQYVSDVENTVIYFAVGEKDMESNPRFRFDNIDDKGINQKIKGGATYYQMINTYKDEPLPMNKRGYILKVPTISTQEEVASASAFRKAISTAPDKESAKLIFNKQFKQFDNDVFELVYNKLKGDKMSEDLNIMKQLAGLEVTEGAPIEFEDQVSVKDIKFAEVSKSSSKLSIANRFPEGSDVNDMDTKKDMYVKELMKSPVALLSEINERIMPDENGLAVSTKLNKILDGMRDSGIADLDAEDKGFVMDLVKHSLKNMDLEAGDNREFDPETSSLESVQLDDVRSDYGIEEGYTYDLDGPDLVITSPKGKTKVIKDFTYFDEKPSQAELKSFFDKGISQRDDMDEGKVKDMAMDQADAFYDKVSSVADETNDIQKAIIDAWKDEEENPPVWALDDGAKDILADAGLIDEEPEEPEMEESIEEGNCPKCGEKRHKLTACASCGCSESFDPKMEPTKKDEIMSDIADANFDSAGEALGLEGGEVMQDWGEFCGERGLDQEDALEEIDHIENFVDEMLDGAEDKYYPAEMESIEEQESAVVGKALDSAMIELKKLAGLY